VVGIQHLDTVWELVGADLACLEHVDCLGVLTDMEVPDLTMNLRSQAANWLVSLGKR